MTSVVPPLIRPFAATPPVEKVTLTPPFGLPFASRTITDGAVTLLPAIADWLVVEFAATCVAVPASQVIVGLPAPAPPVIGVPPSVAEIVDVPFAVELSVAWYWPLPRFVVPVTEPTPVTPMTTALPDVVLL